jgi:hypothetical protein
MLETPRQLSIPALGFLLLFGGCAEYRGRSEPPAGQGERSGKLATLGHDLRDAGKDLAGAAVHEVPPHTAGQWIYLGGLAASSAYLETRKEDIRRQVLRSGAFRSSGWSDVGGEIGLSRNVEIAAAAFYAGGLLADMPRTRETGLLMGESLFAAQTATGLLKFVFSEQRPQQGGELRYFHSGGTSASVHMTNAMAVARVLDHQLSPEIEGSTARTLVRIGLYALPAVTGWQRLRSDQHYLWNVVLGGGASLYMTDAVLRAHDRRAAGAETSRAVPTVLALPAPGRGGEILLVWSR